MNWNDGLFKQDFVSIMRDMVGICTMVDMISKQTTSVELVLKMWRKKIEESQLSSRSKDLFTNMEEDTLRYSGYAHSVMVSDSSHESLSKGLKEAIASGNYNEDQMEKLRKIQEATTRSRNNDTALFLKILEKYKDDYVKMLTKMQQDVSTAFDCFLERLRNMQGLKEENQSPVSVNHTLDSGCNDGAFKTKLAAIKMKMHRVSELTEEVSKWTKSMKRFKEILRKDKERGKNSGYEHLVRVMEEEASRASGLAQTAIISSLERLSKTLQEVTCGGYEQQLETMRKMQQDLESLRKRLDDAISSNYAQHPNQPGMLMKMQQDVSAAFDSCLESLRSMQVVEELD